MQSYRFSSRLPQALKVVKAPMACYGSYARPSHRFNGLSAFPVADFASLFRLFDEELGQATSRPLRSWQPRFDVREEKENFHLQGELPGIDSKDVSIEFADENTMVIRGQTVREQSTGIKPKSVEHSPSQDQIEESTDAASETASTSSYKKPTVEDEFVEVESEKATATPATSAPENSTLDTEQQQQQLAGENHHAPKYWVSERSVGSFHRTFAFPGKIDQDSVTASLKNGILSVVVPKAVAKEPRKITIN